MSLQPALTKFSHPFDITKFMRRPKKGTREYKAVRSRAYPFLVHRIFPPKPSLAYNTIQYKCTREPDLSWKEPRQREAENNIRRWRCSAPYVSPPPPENTTKGGQQRAAGPYQSRSSSPRLERRGVQNSSLSPQPPERQWI